MRRLRTAIALALLPLAAGGCVAAAVPVAVGGLIARDQLGSDKERRPKQPEQKDAEKAQPASGELKTAEARAMMQAIEARQAGKPQPELVPAPAGALSPPPVPPGVSGTPGLGGTSGEAAAFSLQAYQALWNHLAAQAGKRQRGEPLQSVVLAPGTTLDAPRYAACENKPLAVVFDIDESAEKAGDPDAPWRRWKGDGTDLVAATPGAVEGIEAARRENIAVIFTSRRAPESAPGVTALLDRLGFGRFEAGRTLILRGDAEAARGDEQVRQVLAAGYCVVALVGDSLNDFSSQFEVVGDAGKRQTAATETMVAPLWGAGWFILPNPVRSIAATPSQ